MTKGEIACVQLPSNGRIHAGMILSKLLTYHKNGLGYIVLDKLNKMKMLKFKQLSLK